MNPTKKTKAAPLPIRELDRYHARPSTTERGQWTVMEQLAGETSLRLFTRARDVEAAARILEALRGRYLAEVERIAPAFVVEIGTQGFGTPATVNVYADGSVFRAVDADGLPLERVPKREHAAWTTPSGWSLATVVEQKLAELQAAAALGGAP